MSRRGVTLSDLAPVEISDDGDARTVQHQVYDQLRGALMSGRIEPGEGISLRGCAAAMGTSLTPVREALRQLASEGGLVQGANRMLSVPLPRVAEFRELCCIRVALEGLATEAAAKCMTSEELASVCTYCEAMQRAAAGNDIEAYLKHNWHFHSAIYRAARMPVLLSIIEDLWLRVGPLIRLATPKPGHFAHSMDAHWASIYALRAGDGTAARAAIERDIRDASDDLCQVLESERGVMP